MKVYLNRIIDENHSYRAPEKETTLNPNEWNPPNIKQTLNVSIVVSGCQCFMAIGLRAGHVLLKRSTIKREVSDEGQGQ
jgi:hypothetical protein